MKSWESFEEERAGARKKALVLLTDMDRSESELSEKLKRAGFSDAAVRDALAYVKSLMAVIVSLNMLSVVSSKVYIICSGAPSFGKVRP